MSFGFRTKRADAKTDAEAQPVETNEPEARQAPLRDILREKLMALAQEGNVQAIRELLDRPNLLEKAETDAKICGECGGPKNLTHEEACRQMDEFLDKMEARARAANPNYVADRFFRAVRERLEDEAEHELLRRWEGLGRELKDQVWATILERVCEPENEEELLTTGQATIQ